MMWRDKDMPLFGRRKKIAYGFYLTAVALLLLFWRFPGDSARDFAQRAVKRLHPQLGAGIGRVGLVFPPGVNFRDVAWSYNKEPITRTDYIRLRPGLWSLFGSSSVCYIKAGAYGGVISGKCRITKDREAEADLQAGNLTLENVDWLRRLTTHRFSGRMNGTLKAKFEKDDVQAESHLVFSDITVTLAAPVLDFQSLRLSVVDADVSATRRRMEIKACTVKGPEIEGEFSGDILVRQPYQMSVLNLKGFLRPQASFLKQAGKTLPIDLLMKKEQGGKGIPVKLTGTIQSPQFGFQ
ncbi:MAG: type II secretion system protein GspN [Thermodesulfobacteriota bacterium]